MELENWGIGELIKRGKKELIIAGGERMIEKRNTIKENWERVQEEIIRACQRVGRDPKEIQIVAVTKGKGVETIREAMGCGLTVFGENRWQEAEGKMKVMPSESIQWHYIGRLQTNKVKKVIECFHFIHSVDREEVLMELEKRLEIWTVEPFPVFLQVNLAERKTQGGISEKELGVLWEKARSCPHLLVCGLMTIGPREGDEKVIRAVFRRLWELRDRLGVGGVLHLSMGMSDDYPLAVEEGATMLRLGRVLFGERG
ncbi:MAG: YggS family pyridoxal phosphate-dependent enzyme [Candidatus Atribacteria bacterium]|nr:YggS family pyridoxal phosphate-dependent enzyme [Candidatus Atribacteria bacterium]